MFEIADLQFAYDERLDEYTVVDFRYELALGTIVLEEGPAYVFRLGEDVIFLTLRQVTVLANVLEDLNKDF